MVSDCIANVNCVPDETNPNICVKQSYPSTCNCYGIPLTSEQACHMVEPKGVIIACKDGFNNELCYCAPKMEISEPGDECYPKSYGGVTKSCANSQISCKGDD